MLGEETKRPFNFKVVRTSEIATSELQEKAKQMLMDYIQATIMSKLGPEE
nr:MAG TPA: portal protein [Bacteriophage sp.]